MAWLSFDKASNWLRHNGFGVIGLLRVVAIFMSNEMGAPAVLGVAGERPVANAMASLDVMAWVVTPHRFAISGPAAIAVFFPLADRTWPAPA